MGGRYSQADGVNLCDAGCIGCPMTQNRNRPPSGHSAGGDYENGLNTGKVIALPIKGKTAGPFEALTYQTVMAQHAAGDLPAGIVAALLVGCGVCPS
jgi:hypothetical protein